MQINPEGSVLKQLQKHIETSAFDKAIPILTRLILKAQLPGLLCTRSLCYFQNKQYLQSKNDCVLLLTLKIYHSPSEILPGCFTSYTLAYTLLSKGNFNYLTD